MGTFALLVFFGVLFLADGKTDAFYLRFTTAKQHSLILGTSRAAQGLRPDVLNSQLGTELYNYSFTLGQSPYGPTYYKSIKAKLDTTQDSSIFILSVDPYSISSSKENPNDTLSFPERELCLGNTIDVTSKPNFSYLYNNLGGRYYQILMPKLKEVILHDDGWLEVSVSMDSEQVDRRRQQRLRQYAEGPLKNRTFSLSRFASLKRIIKLLNRYGNVYLVRLPVHPDMRKLDNAMDPFFEQRIEELLPMVTGFFDMAPFDDEFAYTDGNHIAKESAENVSLLVGEFIVNH